MITRLLLALDPTPSSHAAAAAALAIARASGACIEAIAVIDTPWITRAQAVGIGGTAYRVHAEQTELHAARAQAKAAIAALCQAGPDVACAVHQEEGDPAALLAAHAMDCDLIVLGQQAHFWGEADGDVSEVVRALLHNDPRPVLLTPAQPAPGNVILVAIDGSMPSSRSLHMLALLGLARERPVRVISIGTEIAVLTPRTEQAATLLRAHGAADVTPVAIVSDADPAEIIVAQARECGAGLIAMGAYGHSGIRQFLFGSATQHLLRQGPTSLFVHH